MLRIIYCHQKQKQNFACKIKKKKNLYNMGSIPTFTDHLYCILYKHLESCTTG